MPAGVSVLLPATSLPTAFGCSAKNQQVTLVINGVVAWSGQPSQYGNDAWALFEALQLWLDDYKMSRNGLAGLLDKGDCRGIR